ncbi:MAG: hypothetical protein KatS3mg131_2087 [Candidatus Tectimicrobiota bacterium]|nr:MAG: hypothetical protein KatS3mg131_2087 [Candidatus Tectomicrobia bacterium]
MAKLLDDGFYPIVWCRYVATAEYVADGLRKALARSQASPRIVCVTGRTGDDEVRRAMIDEIDINSPRVLVATDCLSEGINLQEKFNAALHYDLPWNPNRLEQREGRVDRYGQPSAVVKTIRYFGRNNPVDGVVLDVLLNKAREIHRTLGTHVPVPEESESVTEAVLNALFLRGRERETDQLELALEVPEVRMLHRRWDENAARERVSRTRFAQRALKPEEVRRELEAADAVLGDPAAVREFVLAAAQRLGLHMEADRKRQDVYRIAVSQAATAALPEAIRFVLPQAKSGWWLVSFVSPTPEGAEYLGRNHRFVATLARYLLEEALTRHGEARALPLRRPPHPGGKPAYHALPGARAVSGRAATKPGTACRRGLRVWLLALAGRNARVAGGRPCLAPFDRSKARGQRPHGGKTGADRGDAEELAGRRRGLEAEARGARPPARAGAQAHPPGRLPPGAGAGREAAVSTGPSGRLGLATVGVTMNTLRAIRIEGGLLGPDTLEALLAGELPGQRPQDFDLGGRTSLTDEIAAVFSDARALWGVFQNRLARLSESDMGTSVTRDAWLVPFLGLLGYELRYNPRAYEIDGLTFAISHRAGEAEDAPPVHLVGARQELGRLPPSGRPRLSPHALVQEYLNRSDRGWGLVSNGLTLRLLRDSTFVRRQAYVEFDLRAILEEQLFPDFSVLYRLLHRSRLPRTAADAATCLLEQYYNHALEQGGRVRDRLRDGVEECLKRLANGFLAHPANEDLRRRIAPDSSAPDRLTAQDLYRELLRLVYRFLFLLVSEERGLISQNSLYCEHYGVARLRRLLDARGAYTAHDDLWHSLRVLWKVFRDPKLAALLDVAPLDGELFAPLAFDAYTITNRDLLEAFWHLAYYEDEKSHSTRRVNYAALDVEELGSVYESLLEFHPVVTCDRVGAPRFDLVFGSERKSTGSYYTPAELVSELVRSALEPVLAERLAKAKTPEEKARAVLSLRVVDPACGSGHFLLAAARRLAKELARIRTGEEEPAPERVREAIREVIAHAIYGVDKNPLAVELCRVALWIEVALPRENRSPFSTTASVAATRWSGCSSFAVLAGGIPDEAYKPGGGDDRAAAREARRRNASERGTPLFHESFTMSLQKIAEPLRALEDLPEDTPEQVVQKAQVYSGVEHSPDFERLRLACDAWTAAFFQRYPNGQAGPVTTQALHDALARGSLPDPRLAGFVFQTSVEQRFFHWPLAFPEVFAFGGFDVIIGNPPFLGGLRISGTLGDRYRKWVEAAFAPFGGTADLCALFFRQAFRLLKPGGRVGLIATNTLGQGDTRESGLVVILRDGGEIAFAKRFVKWPGQANVEVNLVALHKRSPSLSRLPTRSRPVLDGRPVEFISSRLDAEPEEEPRRLSQNEGRGFIGDYVRGIGFVLDPEEAERLLTTDPRNADCLFPYLNGEDLNSHPEQKPSRWVICFHDWDLERAEEYPDLLRIVEERVKPERQRLRGPGDRRNREYWWQFGAYRTGMRRAIAPLRRVLVRSRVSELHAMAFVPQGWIYNEQLVVFAFDDDYHFALLQSNVHEAWVWRQASSLESRNRYTPTDCFDTFPFPPPEYETEDLSHLLAQPPFAEAARLGSEYHEHRRQVMLARNIGLTKTYNLFHDPNCTDADIQRLRDLHTQMDRAILACYDWADMDLKHGFYPNDRGQTRFTVSQKSRRELLCRLLDLNLRPVHESKK